MPCITLPYDFTKGPLIQIGISPPKALPAAAKPTQAPAPQPLAGVVAQPLSAAIRSGLSSVPAKPLAPAAAPAPAVAVAWFDALVDTGASNSSITHAAAMQAGLPVIGKTNTQNSSAVVACKVYLADVRLSFAPGVEVTVPNIPLVELPMGNAHFSALIGRDALKHGTLFYNGRESTFTLCL